MQVYSMQLENISSKQDIERFLRKDVFLHIYSIGDLDDFFWYNTQWFAIKSDSRIKAILLLYHDNQLPVLLALNRGDLEIQPDIIKELSDKLPDKYYGHITDDFIAIMRPFYEFTTKGIYNKMGLVDHSIILNLDISGVVTLSEKDDNEIQSLYRISYPDNWLNRKMLEIGNYYGIM